MSQNDVIIVGYPKSGNTWLSRLVGDILDSPVTGWETARPICEEGKDRPGKYTVRQLHMKPIYEELSPNFNAWQYGVPSAQGEKLLLITRNPLDVMVSVYHYWQMTSMDDAIDAVLFGRHPLIKIGPIVAYYNMWEKLLLNSTGFSISAVRYESLIYSTGRLDGYTYLRAILNDIGLGEEVTNQRISEAMERQSFDVRKKELEKNGNNYNYGKDVQMRNLRRGKIGSWRDEMTPEQVDYATMELRTQGYQHV